MIRLTATVSVLLVAGAASAGPEDEIHRLVAQWRTAEAAARVEPLLAALPDLPAIQEAAGMVKFHQQAYADAVDLMRRARASGGGTPTLFDLIVTTHEVTRTFVSVPGKRFEVRTAPGPDEVLAPYLHEALEQALDRLGPRFGVEVTRPIVVEVYPSTEAFSRVSTLPMKAIRTSGTIALCKFDRLMLISPRVTLRGYDWLDTAVHELVHLLISRRSHNTVPVWLHEGLAKYHEAGWRRSFGEPLEPYSAGLLAQAVNDDALITFAQMSPSMALLPSREATATAFAEVLTAIEFLVLEYGDTAVLGLLDGMRRHQGSEDAAFRAVTGGDRNAFEVRWKRWVRTRKFERHDGARAPALAFGRNRAAADDNDPERPEGEAGRRARLGDLLYRRGHHRAAAIEYARSVTKAGHGFAGLVHRLAECQIASGDFAAAQVVLDKSVTLAPDDPRSWILLGRLNLRRKDYSAAHTAYREANRFNPFDPEVHDALWRIAKERGDAAAISREAKARELLSRGPPRSPQNKPRVIDKKGFLELSSTPWGRVIIDEQPIGRGTPLTDYALPEGRHTIEIRNDAAGRSKRLVVEIKAGQTVRHKLALDPAKESSK
jgi:Tfp pilus assembly protein PilF